MNIGFRVEWVAYIEVEINELAFDCRWYTFMYIFKKI
jgi:hypothetical protein